MKYNYSSNSNDYKTPPVLYKKALDKFGINKFSCDVCCSDENIPAVNYCKQHETDGLKEEWAYKYWFYCWCNPPFKYCIKWVKKAFEESRKGINVAMLIPARTETAYFHKYILNQPNVEIEFLRKGYKFLNSNNEEMGIFKNALCLVYFKAVEND